MDFRDFAARETAAVLGRLVTQEAASQARRARAALEAAAQALDGSPAAENLDEAVRELAGRLDAATARAIERIQTDAHGTVDALQAELADARQAAAALREELAVAAAARDAEASTVAALRAELAGLADRAAAAEADLDATIEAHRLIESELAAARHDLDAARRTAADLETTREDAGRTTECLAAQIDTLQAERSRLEVALAAADAALAEQTATRAALLAEIAAACRSLGHAESVGDLLGTLVRQVSTAFGRTAVFRVRSHHLEGEHAVGFDQTGDVSKLVLPFSTDSLVTRAHASRTMVRQDVPETGSSPLGGSPAMAVAIPLACLGEPVAVLYADAEDPSRGEADERPAYAAVLASHAAAVLDRMSHELKALEDLRQYAAMLLQEAEQMYASDTEAGVPDDDRRRRLQDTLDCARQLYAQRASLEGSAAALLFDELLAAVAASSPPTPFSRDLAHAGPLKEARRTATAS